MLIVKVPHYSSDIPYKQLLKLNTKKMLTQYADLLLLPIKKSIKKDEFVEAMDSFMKYDSQNWLQLLPYYEIELLKQVVNKPKGEPVTIFKPIESLHLCIVELDLVVIDDSEENKWNLYLSTEDIRETLLKRLKETEESADKFPEREKWTKMGYGLLNYYGLIPFHDFYQEMKRRNGIEDNMNESIKMINFITQNCAFSTMTFTLTEETSQAIYLHSPYMENINDILDEMDSRPEIHADYKKATNEELMKYGELPFITPSNNSEKKFHTHLTEQTNDDKEKADWLFNQAWYMVQTSHKHSEVLSILSKHLLHDSMAAIQKFTVVFTEFSNNMPKWFLKGWSSEEIFKKFEKPKMRPLPGMPFMPFGNSIFDTTDSSRKVGRNDPCPCGSGKKYKNCCMKKKN